MVVNGNFAVTECYFIFFFLVLHFSSYVVMQAAIRTTGELVHWELNMTLMVNKVDGIQSGA